MFRFYYTLPKNFYIFKELNNKFNKKRKKNIKYCQ